MEEIQLETEEKRMEELQLNMIKNEEPVPELEDYSDITLRLFDPSSDIDDFMVWVTDDKVSQFCSWDTYTSKEAAMNYMIDVILPHPWFRAICLKNRPIGAISVAECHGYDRCRGELGYVLASKYWGKGITTKAVKMAVNSIFVEWPHLERLEALVDVDNLGSLKVLEKVGLQKEGVLRKYIVLKGRPRDMVIFSLLSTDPQVTYFM